MPNGCEFIADGGYATPTLWLADGWNIVRGQDWGAPLYWEEAEGGAAQMSLNGFRPIDPAAPGHPCQLLRGRRLCALGRLPPSHRVRVGGGGGKRAARRPHARKRPFAADAQPDPGEGLKQMIGDVWEWTGSAYLPYPGFRAAPGAVGEYNGKFMCNQFVLRGGSCVTPEGHIRRTYRNFFYPHQRWQFTGLRLAQDA